MTNRMTKVEIKRRFDRLRQKQSDLESVEPSNRNHEHIARCVQRKLALLGRDEVSSTLWAHNRRCEMAGRHEDKVTSDQFSGGVPRNPPVGFTGHNA